MANRVVWCLLCVLLALPAAGQPPILYGIRGNGDLVWINPATGAATLVGSSGVEANAIAAYVYEDPGRYGAHIDQMLTAGGVPADRINVVDRWTGGAFGFAVITGMPAGYTIRGMVRASDLWSPIYAILGADDPTAIDLLATISDGVCTVIGSAGRTDLETIALSPGLGLYAIGSGDGGRLYRLSEAGGQATPIGGGGLSARGLAFLPDGRLLACGDNLLQVDPVTGATTLIGPTGMTDIRGLTVDEFCYADCDPYGPPPRLNIPDFGCFFGRYLAGDPSANCDGSAVPPTLNVADFFCFLNAFAGGCR